jgi:hypothetical protein
VLLPINVNAADCGYSSLSSFTKITCFCVFLSPTNSNFHTSCTIPLNIFLWFNNKYNLIVIMLLQKSSYYSNSSYGASSNFNIHHLSKDIVSSFTLSFRSLYKALAIQQAPA